MCAMNFVVCILLLRALRRGGGGRQSIDNETKMTSSGSGAQFLSRWEEGEEEECFGRVTRRDK